MSKFPTTGIKSSRTILVTERLSVPHLGDPFDGLERMPPVFATPFLIAFIEWTCICAVQPNFDADQFSVGTHVDVRHLAATSVGMNVHADVELVSVEGAKLKFDVLCRDDKEVIAKGFHQRFIVKRSAFDRGIADKIASLANT